MWRNSTKELTSREMTAYAKAKRDGYPVCAIRPNLANVWWRWCEQNNHPYVTVNGTRVKYDLHALNRELTAAGFIKVFEYREQFDTRSGGFSAGMICGGFRAKRETAEDAARTIVQLLADPENVIDPHALADRKHFSDDREAAVDAWFKGRKAARATKPASRDLAAQQKE